MSDRRTRHSFLAIFRVRQTGGLDQDIVEAVPPLEQLPEDANEVASDGAADAAVVHLEDLLVGVDD